MQLDSRLYSLIVLLAVLGSVTALLMTPPPKNVS